MRQKSRQLAFCGVLCALAVVLLTLGSLVPLATFCCPILAMFALLPVQEEFGSGSALAAYAAAAILALLLVPDKEVALLFLFLGDYPILRLYLNRISSKALRLLCKLAVFNAAVLLLYALMLYVFQLAAVAEDFSELSCLMLAAALLIGNLIFLLLDRVLGPLTLLYRRRLRTKLFLRL